MMNCYQILFDLQAAEEQSFYGHIIRNNYAYDETMADPYMCMCSGFKLFTNNFTQYLKQKSNEVNS